MSSKKKETSVRIEYYPVKKYWSYLSIPNLSSDLPEEEFVLIVVLLTPICYFGSINLRLEIIITLHLT